MNQQEVPHQVLLAQTTLCVTNMLALQLGHELIDFWFSREAMVSTSKPDSLICTMNWRNLYVIYLLLISYFTKKKKKKNKHCQNLHYPYYYLHHLMSLIHLCYMNLDYRRNLNENTPHTKASWLKLGSFHPWLKPWTFLLWGNSSTHRATVPPNLLLSTQNISKSFVLGSKAKRRVEV